MKYIWDNYERRYELSHEEVVAFTEYLKEKTGCEGIQEIKFFRNGGKTCCEIKGIELGGYKEV